ncbi:endonuclease/exonuclease/phosphatase family protein [Streptomyces sp. SID12488]|nr:endonuclease/exonuclease/phosphatase family protein [Streptomyces sp. SID12488]NEA68996.1 endonuclease/exonuclease/phosphatase family protein [Streptomyces sp. SID12488]
MFWNLYRTGLERHDGDDTRWEAQRRLILRERPDVLMVTEAWCWDLDDEALFADAKRDLGMDGVLFRAKTECHQAILWRPGVELCAVDGYPPELHLWHGFGSTVLRLPGRSGPVRFVVAHLDPYSPLNRRLESDRLRGFVGPHTHGPVLVAMDANTVPPGDPEPDWSAVPAHRLGNHLPPDGKETDRAPVAALLDEGLFTDVGAAGGDRRPTVRNSEEGDPARRIDLFLASGRLLPGVDSYRAVADVPAGADGRPASDHAPIVLRLRPEAETP